MTRYPHVVNNQVFRQTIKTSCKTSRKEEINTVLKKHILFYRNK